MQATANTKGKQAEVAEDVTEPAYSDEDEDGPVTMEELSEQLSELRGLVMLLAEPALKRLAAKELVDAKRAQAAQDELEFPGSVLSYFRGLAALSPVLADAPPAARQMVIDALAAGPPADTPAKQATAAYRAMSPAGKKLLRAHYLSHLEALPPVQL